MKTAMASALTAAGVKAPRTRGILAATLQVLRAGDYTQEHPAEVEELAEKLPFSREQVGSALANASLKNGTPGLRRTASAWGGRRFAYYFAGVDTATPNDIAAIAARIQQLEGELESQRQRLKAAVGGLPGSVIDIILASQNQEQQ